MSKEDRQLLLDGGQTMTEEEREAHAQILAKARQVLLDEPTRWPPTGEVGEKAKDELYELRYMREQSRRVLARWGDIEAWIAQAKAHLRLKLRDGEDDVAGLGIARRIEEILHGMGGQP